ncbi:MAG: hypothetical protein H0T46_29385 [Deltaproteobacteria bacterium]|nr:hypothetical protein [Deltaproteobacteria bacterium]
MRKQDALFVAMCAGAIAFAVAFIAPPLASAPVLWYFPLEGRWSFEVRPEGLAMDFYGRMLFALAAWAVVVLITLPLAKRVKGISTRAIGLITAWTLTTVLLVMLQYAWTLYFRRPMPEPIPTWYVPR